MIITAAEMGMRRALRETAPLAKVHLDDRQTAILARACARIVETSRPPVDARSTVAAVRPTAVKPRAALSTQNLQVLALVAEGLESAEIGDRLHLSEHAVKCRLKRIYADLKAKNRAMAVAAGYELGLLGTAAVNGSSR